MTAASYELQRLDALRAAAKPAHAPERENVVSKFLADQVEPQEPAAVAPRGPVAVATPAAPEPPAVQSLPTVKTPLRVSDLAGTADVNGPLRSRGYVSLRDSLGAGPE